MPGFDLPLQPAGTAFQQKVWTELLAISFGKTVSYLQLARALGDEKCIRAAASANGQNPLTILVPCHRVIRKTGAFGQYRWGPARKRAMLGWESARNYG